MRLFWQRSFEEENLEIQSVQDDRIAYFELTFMHQVI